MDHRERLIQEYERTLHFQFFFGGRTLYKHPYVRPWRTLPFMLVARATRNPFRLDFQGSEGYTLVPGQVMVVPPGVPHRVASVLKRYDIRTEKTTGGRRSYRSVTIDCVRRACRTYGFCIDSDEPSSLDEPI